MNVLILHATKNETKSVTTKAQKLRFTFNKAIWVHRVIEICKPIAFNWLLNWRCKPFFACLPKPEQKEKSIFQYFFGKTYCALRCVLRYAVLCYVADIIVQFYLRAWKNKFGIVTIENLLQWNLWIADAYASYKICPLLRGVLYWEVV